MVKNRTETDFGKLYVPSEQFYNFIINCNTVFNDVIDKIFFENSIQMILYTLLNSKVDRAGLVLCDESLYMKC